MTQTIERDLKLFLLKNIASGTHILKHVLIVFGKVKTNKTNRNQRIASFQIVLFSLHITSIMPPVRSPLPHCRMCSWEGKVRSIDNNGMVTDFGRITVGYDGMSMVFSVK